MKNTNSKEKNALIPGGTSGFGRKLVKLFILSVDNNNNIFPNFSPA